MIDNVQHAVIFDMYLNFIEGSKSVKRDLSMLMKSDRIEEGDKNVITTVCQQIMEEADVQIKEAEDYLEKEYLTKRPNVGKLIAHRRAAFFTLVQMRDFVNHEQHAGSVEQKQAAIIAEEIKGKIRELKTQFLDPDTFVASLKGANVQNADDPVAPPAAE